MVNNGTHTVDPQDEDIFSQGNLEQRLADVGEVDVTEDYPTLESDYYKVQVVGKPKLGEREGKNDNAGYRFLLANWQLKVIEPPHKGAVVFYRTDLGRNKDKVLVDRRFWRAVKAILGDAALKEVNTQKDYGAKVAKALELVQGATAWARVVRQQRKDKTGYINFVDGLYHPDTELSQLPAIETQDSTATA